MVRSYPMDDGGFVGSEPARPGGGPDRPLTGGIVAYNEEANLEASVGSLLRQRLPPGYRWDRIWIVASGCTDRTEEIARRLAADDDRLGLIVETERRGKAAAIDLVLRRAAGERVILLNSDARAEEEAVAGLLAVGESLPAPYAVMGHPVPPPRTGEPVARAAGLLWALHHEFHLATLRGGPGNHLSDELLLLRLPGFAGLPSGVINDGSYFGAWLTGQGGAREYAPGARVAIQIPGSWSDHLRQRRRIRVGHAQVRELFGRPPSTLSRLAGEDPAAALRILRRTVGVDPRRLADLFSLLVPEVLAAALAAWDRIPPRRDHGRWERIRRPVGWPEALGTETELPRVS